MILCKNHILLDKYKAERIKYEEYIGSITKEKVLYARDQMDAYDLRILKLISELKICTSHQIANLLFKEKNNPVLFSNRRLKKLYRLGCIDRFFPSIDKGRLPTHITLAVIGAKVLEKRGFRRLLILNQNWKHTVAINEVLSHHKMNHEKFIIEDAIVWNESKIIPDIQLIGESSRKFIEVDMGTETIAVLKEKVENYYDYSIYNKDTNFTVLFACKYEETIKKLEKFVSILPNKNMFQFEKISQVL